jgi:2-succinyl-5-enolpyruvyl-6-hydroxy-3-cyclohexene-1-carboxylate synthase
LADRPQSKIDIGDGQTIRQENVFANHSLYNANLNEVVSVENDTKINEAISISIGQKACTYKCSFEEPLYETVSELSVPTVIASAKCRTHFQKMRYGVCYDLE